MLAHCSLLIEGPSDFLGCSSNRTVGWISLSASLPRVALLDKRTVEHLADRTVLGEHAGAGTLGLVASRGLKLLALAFQQVGHAYISVFSSLYLT